MSLNDVLIRLIPIIIFIYLVVKGWRNGWKWFSLIPFVSIAIFTIIVIYFIECPDWMIQFMGLCQWILQAFMAFIKPKNNKK